MVGTFQQLETGVSRSWCPPGTFPSLSFVFLRVAVHVCSFCGPCHRPKQPLLHTYYYYGNPMSLSRVRRYIAYQMDYSKAMVESEDCLLYVLKPFLGCVLVTLCPVCA
jgi:hypothetical protein